MALLGRRTLWRLARSLYLKARGDSPNAMKFNGEQMIQLQLLREFAGNSEKLVIFDIGANIGDWTWFLLQESSKLKIENRLEVHAFEPISSTFEALQRRISRHPLCSIVRLVSQAMSSEEGMAEMYVLGENAQRSSLYADATQQCLSRVQVLKTTAYAYCDRNNVKTIHFLKCDTEGNDMEVLYGARRLFEEQRVMACQFEYNHQWVYSRHYLKDVFEFAENIPYNVGKVTPKGIEAYQKWHPELERFFEGNYMLLHSDALRWFLIQRGKYDMYNTYSAQGGVDLK